MVKTLDFKNLFRNFRVPLIKRRKKAAIVIAAVLLVVLFFYWRSAANTTPSYLTQKVKTGDIKQSISCTGTVQPVQSLQLSFKNSGSVNNILVQVNDQVTAGQLLATQDTKDLELEVAQAEASLQIAQANLAKQQQTGPAALKQAEAQVNEAKAKLAQAAADRDRTKMLYDAGAESRSNLDAAETAYTVAEQTYQSALASLEAQKAGSLSQDLASAEAQVKSASIGLQKAQNNLEGAKIIAPFSGYIAQINGSTGQWTQGGAPPASTSTSSSMFYITLVSKELNLSCQVNEADIAHIAPGQTATFTVDPYPGRTFTGTVKSVAPLATTVSNVQMFNVIITIPDQEEDGLKAGLPANVNIITDVRNNVLLVPQTALAYAKRDTAAEGSITDGAEQVIVMRNGRPVRVPVTIGLKDDVMAEVLSGLQEGDEVVIGTSTNTAKTNQSTSSQGSRQNNQRSGAGFPPLH